MDANIMHISYESGILEDPSQPAPEELYVMTKSPQNAPNTPVRIDIVFSNGLPVRCSNTTAGNTCEQSLHILQYLNQIGGKWAFQKQFVLIKIRNTHIHIMNVNA